MLMQIFELFFTYTETAKELKKMIGSYETPRVRFDNDLKSMRTLVDKASSALVSLMKQYDEMRISVHRQFKGKPFIYSDIPGTTIDSLADLKKEMAELKHLAS